jgi:hypothetical protein
MKSLLTSKAISFLQKGIMLTLITILVLFSSSFAQKQVESKVSKELLSNKANIAEVTKNEILDKNQIWNFKVQGFPNPYIDKLNFSFETPIKGQARLQLFTLEGQRLAFVIIKHVAARSSATITYYIPSEQRVPLIYKFTLGGQTATGRMSPVENLSAR